MSEKISKVSKYHCFVNLFAHNSAVLFNNFWNNNSDSPIMKRSYFFLLYIFYCTFVFIYLISQCAPLNLFPFSFHFKNNDNPIIKATLFLFSDSKHLMAANSCTPSFTSWRNKSQEPILALDGWLGHHHFGCLYFP